MKESYEKKLRLRESKHRDEISMLRKRMAERKERVETKEETEKPIQGQKKRKRVSICLPDSIIDNAQSRELKTYLVGQIARAAAIFNVVEIVIFKESRRR